MQSAKQKLRDMASTAKEKLTICRAKADEKAEKTMAQTKEEKEIAHERRKVKEAEAKMDMHMAKEAHAEEKLMTKQSHYHVSHGPPHLPHHEPMQAQAQGIEHGYGHNAPGVTSMPPPAAYPTGPTSVPPAAYPPGASSVPPAAYPPTGQHYRPY